jgi:hypothetical protein
MPACPILFYIVGNQVLHIQSKFHVFRSFRSKTREKILKYLKKFLIFELENAITFEPDNRFS